MSYKGGERITMLSGSRALTDHQQKEYNVSHKTIALIVNPESKAKNDQYIKEHWMFYAIDSESQRLAHRRTEEYKKRLYQKGELK